MALKIRMPGWIDFWILNPTEEKFTRLYEKPFPEGCTLKEAVDSINERTASSIDDVAFIEADGEELEFIRQNFVGIRSVGYASSLRWTGDDAKFIIGNLPKQNIGME